MYWGGGRVWTITHLVITLSSGSVALGLGATRVVPAVIILILLFLLRAAAEHGENRRRGDRLLLRRLGLLDLRVGVLGGGHLESGKTKATLGCMSVKEKVSRSRGRRGKENKSALSVFKNQKL